MGNNTQKRRTEDKMSKFIFVTGGVVSGLGKGIVAASLGRLLKCRGLKIASQKLDPYMNVDPGTMNPIEHGEVFVTEDGLEADLDLGHYERFIDENLTKFSNLTSGRVFWNVLTKERRGEYLGKTVQIVPHITNEIKDFILKTAKTTAADVVITEIGGTVGDIEGQPFIEAIRQLSYEVGRENCLFVHVCLVPYISGSDEYKSKPTQHSVHELQSFGIHPNIIVTRSDAELSRSMLDKIAMFCNVKNDCVINNVTLSELYECPLYLHSQGLDDVAVRELGLSGELDLAEWEQMVDRIHNRRGKVKIALVGKYVRLHDAYISVVEALKHAGYENGVNVDIKWVDSEKITDFQKAEKLLSDADGILVPGGFGDRGVEGKILACRYARENDVPYFGICLGMQIAVIEFARNVCGLTGANSREFDAESPYKVIDLMPDQRGLPKGGTMRLGSYPCKIVAGGIMKTAYGEDMIFERHRHRYEFNSDFEKILSENGLLVSGVNPDKNIVETVEIPKNKFFIGVQFHPEFKSRPQKAHPIFREFVKAAKENRIQKEEK